MTTLLDSFNDIRKEAPEPIYQQIKNIIEQKIRQGEWNPGQKLPSENELVNQLDVSRMTINRALRELTQIGLINRVHGLGSFVAEAPRHASLIELQDIALEVKNSGRQYRSEVLSLQRLKANAEIASKMELEEGTPVYFLKAVHFQNNHPIQFEQRLINPLMVPEFIKQDFTRTTSTAYLLRQFQPDEMEHIVKAIMANDEIQTSLLLNPSQPCLQLTRRTWKKNQVVTWVTLTYPGDRYDLSARYSTSQYQPVATH